MSLYSSYKKKEPSLKDQSLMCCMVMAHKTKFWLRAITADSWRVLPMIVVHYTITGPYQQDKLHVTAGAGKCTYQHWQLSPRIQLVLLHGTSIFIHFIFSQLTEFGERRLSPRYMIVIILWLSLFNEDGTVIPPGSGEIIDDYIIVLETMKPHLHIVAYM